MRFDKRAAVDESRAISVVEIGLGREALRKNDVMTVEFKMPVFDARGWPLRHGLAVL